MDIKIYLIGLVGVVLLLLLTGLIGPSWLKKRIRKYNIWAEKTSSIVPDSVLPTNPYEPLKTKHIWLLVLIVLVGIIIGVVVLK